MSASTDVKDVLDIAIDDPTTSELEGEEIKITSNTIKVPFAKKKELLFSNSPIAKPPKEKFFIWDPPGRSSYERKLVFKLDCVILTYTCLSFFVKYMDASNVSNAYVSGMKEDYNMHGNQYNWLTSGFSLVYALVGLPGTVLMTKIKPHILLPSCELIWGLLTMMVIATSNYEGIVVVRCFQGAVEGMSYPSINYILGSWYTKQELTKRTAIFCVSGTLGTMFGGYIQSGIYNSLQGKGSLPSWKWAFIIDFLITLPVALAGFFVLPDTPSELKPNWFLSEEDLKFCQKRVALEQEHLEETNKFDWRIIKTALTSWQFYVFPLAYSMNQIGEYVCSYWGVALKADGYSVYQANNYPTIASGVGIIVCLVASVWCDYRKNYWEAYTAANLIWIFSFAVIVAWDVPKGLKFFAFCIAKMNDTTAAIICSWANDCLKHDRQLRAFVLGSLNVCYCIFYTSIPLTVWNTKYAPRYKSAHIVQLTIQVISTVFTLVVIFFQRYYQRTMAYIDEQLKLESGQVTYEEEPISEKL